MRDGEGREGDRGEGWRQGGWETEVRDGDKSRETGTEGGRYVGRGEGMVEAGRIGWQGGMKEKREGGRERRSERRSEGGRET